MSRRIVRLSIVCLALAAWAVTPAARADDPTPPVMVLDVTSQAVDAPNDERYLFLDRVYGNARYTF